MLALFVLALGMGVPLIIIGTSFRSVIPKSGPWMITIKHLFGFIMLGMAIWISSRIIPDMITQLLIAALIVVYAITNGVFDKASNGRSKIKKSVLLLVFLYGSSFFVTTLISNKSVVFPLEQVSVDVTQSNTDSMKDETTNIITVTSVAELKQQINKLSKNHTKILIDYYASWCSGCVAIAKELSNPKVTKYLKNNNIVVLKADVSEYGSTSDELLKYFNVFGMPTLILTDNYKHEITRMSGEMSQDKLIDLVAK
jgi:thiol:disulfide interchange protein DsbD